MGVNGIYGLSGSGLDIESMVKVGMMSRQSQYDKMQQSYTKNEWKKETYVNLYNEIQTFNMSTLSKYKMSNNMDAHGAESTNSAIKVTANASAPLMRHSIEVSSAATNAYLIGTQSLTRLGDASSTSTQLRDALFSNLADDTATYTKDGKSLKYVTAADGVQHERDEVAFQFSVSDGISGGTTSSNSDVVTAVADADVAEGTEHTINVTRLASNAVASSSQISRVNVDAESNSSTALKDLLFKSDLVKTTDDNGKVTLSGIMLDTIPESAGTKNLKVNNVSGEDVALSLQVGNGSKTATISFTYGDLVRGATLEDLATKINDAGINISASYDADSDKFSLENTKTGISNKLTLSADNTLSARFLTSLQFQNDSAYTGSSNIPTTFSSNTSNDTTATTLTVTGANAAFEIDGTASTSLSGVDRSTNTITYDGVTYNLESVGESTISVGKSNTISVTYGELADGYTFNDLTSAVNALGTNVKATYDSVNDKFSFYNSQSGAENQVGIAIASGQTAAEKFFDGLGLRQSTNGEFVGDVLDFTAGKSTVASGTDASVKIDGVDYNLSDNKTTVNGVTYDFTNATAGDTSVVSVTQDTETIVSNVKSFIEDYNKLLSDLYKAYDEKPNSNYKPLTEAQKSEMKDDQIEKWEEKAKAGMLYHDQTLGKVIDEMRSAMSSKIEGVAGKYDSIFSIGISTTGLKGQLTLDEDKLRAALGDDPDAVYTVFAKLDANDYNDSAKSGVAQRLGDVLSAANKSIKSVSGTDSSTNDDSDLSKLMRELQTKMSNFKAMMSAFENKLYKKYDAMETVLSSLGVQLNYVTSAFA